MRSSGSRPSNIAAAAAAYRCRRSSELEAVLPAHDTTRRRFIAGAGAASAAIAISPSKAFATESPRRGSVRLLHFTDAHVTPGVARSEALTRRALQAGLGYRPDLVVQGGDAIMDALYANKADTAAQWATHQRIYKGLRTPVAHVVGNHDCWTGPGSTGDPLGGKVWTLREFGLPSSWYALRLGAWKLIVLDSIELTGGGGYVGRLGDEQTAWLRRELLIDHANVRLALSGHNHVRDDITYNKVRFACGGAVSGNWWDESDPGYRDTPPGIAIVDLDRDGSADIAYLSYREVGAREVSADGPARATGS
jgi:3',5'-cyclic-AMP phosphodiesterase